MEIKTYNVYYSGVITIEAENADEATSEAYDKLQDVGEFMITATERED